MEVIKDKLSDQWPKEISCAKCESDLWVGLDDLRYGEWKISGYHFDGSAVCKWLYTFKCPCCGTQANGNEIDADLIPLQRRTELWKERNG